MFRFCRARPQLRPPCCRSSPALSQKEEEEMYHDFNYEATLASSLRAQWQLDDVLRARPGTRFLAQLHAREPWPARPRSTALNPFEQRVLNQISAHQYLSIFGIVEEFILPFLLDHARAASSRRRLARPRAAQLRERGSQAHPPVQALPRSVRPRLPGRVPGDRPVRSDRRRGAAATTRSRSGS